MSSNSPPVYLSEIDEEHFGIRTARVDRINIDTLPSIIDFCQANNVILLIARCLSSDLQVVHAMEQEGFSLMDTLIYYSRNLVKSPIPTDDGKILVRPIRPGEEDKIKSIALETFRGYSGHYHADPRLDRIKCDEAYASWAFRS